MSKTMRRIFLGLLAFFIIIQFIRPKFENPIVDSTQDFVTLAQPPATVVDIMKSACYDCHSNESKYPWYSNVAPVSWWLNDHIKDGRRHLNFSVWGTYNQKKASKKAEEVVETVSEGEMPLKSYTWMHAKARLTKDQRDQLTSWFKNYKPAIKEALNNVTISSPQPEEEDDDDKDSH